jgi:hypothetical protein
MFYVSVGDKRVDPYHSQPGIWGDDRIFVATRDYPKTNKHLPPRREYIERGTGEEDIRDLYTSEEEKELELEIGFVVKGLVNAKERQRWDRSGRDGGGSGGDDWRKEGLRRRG